MRTSKQVEAPRVPNTAKPMAQRPDKQRKQGPRHSRSINTKQLRTMWLTRHSNGRLARAVDSTVELIKSTTASLSCLAPYV